MYQMGYPRIPWVNHFNCLEFILKSMFFILFLFMVSVLFSSISLSIVPPTLLLEHFTVKTDFKSSVKLVY